ncbi:MAG: redox-sensing transcriptional repressor Rex [Bacteroidota bacterium]
MIKNLPPNTVERLSLYRRKLLNYTEEKQFIHSHKLAHLLQINPAHIRRDLMLIGFSGDVHKGYDIENLIISIGDVIDSPKKRKVTFVGIGDLGRAVAEHFNNPNTKLEIAATFRLTEEPKVQFPNVHCYNISKMKAIIKKEKIELCVIAVPKEYAKEISKTVIESGVKGILNFTSVHLTVPDSIYIEDYDMISKLEKLAYFTSE